uniref:Uncharacterized protein n=1 Tax=Mesocestoides corti TaxID=53468 RepID=A0A5K3FQM1_MESCO
MTCLCGSQFVIFCIRSLKNVRFLFIIKAYIIFFS